MPKSILPQEVAKKYNFTGSSGVYELQNERVNLRAITLEKADELFKTGFPFLVKKWARSPKKAKNLIP